MSSERMNPSIFQWLFVVSLLFVPFAVVVRVSRQLTSWLSDRLVDYF